MATKKFDGKRISSLQDELAKLDAEIDAHKASLKAQLEATDSPKPEKKKLSFNIGSFRKKSVEQTPVSSKIVDKPKLVKKEKPKLVKKEKPKLVKKEKPKLVQSEIVNSEPVKIKKSFFKSKPLFKELKKSESKTEPSVKLIDKYEDHSHNILPIPKPEQKLSHKEAKKKAKHAKVGAKLEMFNKHLTAKSFSNEIEEELKKDAESLEEVAEQTWSGKTVLGFLMRYFLVYVLALGILAYLSGSWESFVAFLLFSLFIEIVCNNAHRTSKFHGFTLLGFSIAMPYLLSVYFNEPFAILVTAVYALSFVVASALYLHHRSREVSRDIHKSFPRTFAVVFYSHTIAIMVAMLLMHVLSYFIVGDSFVTITYLLLIWVFPAVVIYFFLTKFLYLRFFDRVHIRRDLSKAIKDGLTYSVVLLVCVWFAYLLSAMQITLGQADTHTANLNGAMGELAGAKLELTSEQVNPDAPNIADLEVTQELIADADKLIEDIRSKRDYFYMSSYGFSNYLTDAYADHTYDDILLTNALIYYKDDILSAKDMLLEEYAELSDEMVVGFSDGSPDLHAHVESLRSQVIGEYDIYSEPSKVSALKRTIFASVDSYSRLIEYTELPSLTILQAEGFNFFNPSSLWADSFMDVARHTVLFRDSLLFLFRDVDFTSRELSNPVVIDKLFTNWAVEESDMSKAIRLRIIHDHATSTKELF